MNRYKVRAAFRSMFLPFISLITLGIMLFRNRVNSRGNVRVSNGVQFWLSTILSIPSGIVVALLAPYLQRGLSREAETTILGEKSVGSVGSDRHEYHRVVTAQSKVHTALKA